MIALKLKLDSSYKLYPCWVFLLGKQYVGKVIIIISLWLIESKLICVFFWGQFKYQSSCAENEDTRGT